MNPFVVLATFWHRFVTPGHPTTAPPTPTASPSASDEVVAERSFASELESLLATTAASERPPNVAEIGGNAVVQTSLEIRNDDQLVDDAPLLGGGLRAISESPNAAEHDNFAPASDPGCEAVTDTLSIGSTSADDDASAQPLIVQSVRASIDRAVPITRLPLRPQSREITWFSPLAQPPKLSLRDRHALLERLAEDRSRAGLELLTQAFHEEDARGRVLALLALAAHHAIEARGTFVAALHSGTDDERIVAVDALAGSNARDALPAAFSDRVDAIAARAALAYVGTNVREDYVRALESHVDLARIEAILALLAGFVE